jgi:hypothetical protein
MKIVQIADGAFFVPSYSEQTIMRAYTLDATVQSFDFNDLSQANKLTQEKEDHEEVGISVHPVQTQRA